MLKCLNLIALVVHIGCQFDERVCQSVGTNKTVQNLKQESIKMSDSMQKNVSQPRFLVSYRHLDNIAYSGTRWLMC